jgi:hemolysin activation/secretion protein
MLNATDIQPAGLRLVPASRIFRSVAVLCLGAAPLLTVAQDFEKVAPRVPGSDGIIVAAEETQGAKVSRPRAVRPGSTADQPEASDMHRPRPGAVRPGEEQEFVQVIGTGSQLLSSLSGLVFVTSADQVRPEGVFGVHGVDARTDDVLATPAFDTVAVNYLGQPVTLDSLKDLNRDVVAFYADHDFPVVDVIIPEQDITGGVVQLIVLKGALGEVRVEGNRHFTDRQILSQVRTSEGIVLRESTMLADVEWLNRNPFRRVDLVYARGREPGLTDVVLRTQDRLPWRFYGGYEDSGNRQTGDARLLGGFNWGNVWGLDHQVNYQFTFNDDTDLFRAHSATYIAPLPWRHLISVFGSHVDIQAKPGTLPGSGTLDLNGRGWQLSTRYTIPLPNWNAYVHEVSAGYDFKTTNNNLEFGGLQVFTTDTDISQFVLSYLGSRPDSWGRTTFGANVYFSPGDMTSNNDDEAFDASRELAEANYTYARIHAQRVQRLPMDWSLIAKGTVQFANSNLLGSEQLGGGGWTSVRGYEERVTNGDDGYILNVELRSPPLRLLRMMGQDVMDELQFLVFIDHGRFELHDPLPLEDPSVTLTSAGPGIRYSIPPYLSVRFDYGWQLRDPGFEPERDRGRSSRMHLGVILSY